MERNKVVLVDQHDQQLGEMDKLLAHQRGELHRAFSVFIFNSQGKMLIHQRAAHKYHGGGLWTNACCSHPQMGEELKSAAQERLQFEMGLVCSLQHVHEFVYHAEVENNLIEHEYDHVFFGSTDQSPNPNPDEVSAFKWISVNDLLQEVAEKPREFTYWFKSVLEDLLLKIKDLTVSLKNTSR